jgi:hypothetical protein
MSGMGLSSRWTGTNGSFARDQLEWRVEVQLREVVNQSGQIVLIAGHVLWH